MVIVVSGRCFKEGVAAFTASFNVKLTRSRRRVSAAAIDAGDQVSHPWIYTVEVSRPCPWIKLCVMIWTKICQEPLQQEFQAGRQVGQVVGFLHECYSASLPWSGNSVAGCSVASRFTSTLVWLSMFVNSFRYVVLYWAGVGVSLSGYKLVISVRSDPKPLRINIVHLS